MKTRLHTFSRQLILRLLFVLCLFLFIGCTFRESSSSNVIIKITDVQVNDNVATVTYEDGYTTQIDLATNSLVYQELDDGTYGVGVFGFQYASYGSTVVGTAPTNSFYALDDKKYEAYDLRLRPYILEMLTEATIEQTIDGQPVTKIAELGFSDCSKLSKINIPTSITEIGSAAFQNCTALESVTIPSSVSRVGAGIFSGCTSLSEIDVAEENAFFASIDGNLYDKTGTTFVHYAPGKQEAHVTVPDSVTNISQAAFAGCTFIQKLTLPVLGSSHEDPASKTLNNLFFVSKDQFSLPHLSSIGSESSEIPSSLKEVCLTGGTELSPKAFAGATSLERVSLPNTLTEVNSWAFADCASLKKVDLPASVVTVGKGIFSGCFSLEEITIPSVESFEAPRSDRILSSYFETHAIENNETNIPPSLKKVTVTGGKDICNGAFANCTSLTRVVINGCPTFIGDAAFQNCTQLASLNIPDSVTQIGSCAFEGCSQIGEEVDNLRMINGWIVSANVNAKDLVVPETAKGVVAGAFYNCTKVESVTISFDSSDSALLDGFLYTPPTSLTSVTVTGSRLPKGAFPDINTIKTVVISDSVTDIEYGALAGCLYLVSLTSPYAGAKQANGNSASIDSLFQSHYTPGFGSPPHTLKHITITKETVIPKDAFRSCVNLETITLLGNVTEIGENAFFSRINLKEISLPSTLRVIKKSAFHGCSSLTSITIPASVSRIEEDAFYGCSSLTSITIPASVSCIEKGAFYGCSNITDVVFEGEVETLADDWFDWSAYTRDLFLTLPSCEYYASNKDQLDFASHMIFREGTTVSADLFKSHRALKTVVLPSSLRTIESSAFENCYSLEKVEITGNLQSVGASAFSNCLKLKQIALPETVTKIEAKAFWNCGSLEEFKIPQHLSTLGEQAFDRCTSLTSIDLSKAPLLTIEKSVFSNCTSLETVILPENLKTIEESAFQGCSALAEVSLESTTLNAIHAHAFEGCSSLTTILLPNTLTTLGASVFQNCTELTAITLPYQITALPSRLFLGCSKLETVTLPNDVASLGFSVFEGCTALAKASHNGVAYLGSTQNPYLIAMTLTDTAASEISIHPDCKFIYNAAFQNATNLIFVSFPRQLISIGSYAFSGCVNLTSLDLPDTLVSIGSYAFSDCIGLTEITLPKSLQTLSSGTFANCTELVSVTFTGTESILHVEDAFYQCTNLKTVVFSGYTYLSSSVFANCSSLVNVVFLNDACLTGEAIFQNCTSLESIIIPERTYHLGRRVFEGCSSLKEIYIPVGMEYISEDTFAGCESLTTIEYGGTMAQWNAISKGSGWNSDLSCTVVCSDGSIDLT